MPNRVDQSYALTVLSPIIGGNTRGMVHATQIRTALNCLDRGADSPLARIPTLHTARFTVLDDVRQAGMPTLEDHLESKYLLFVADFDGDLPEFLDSMISQARECVESVWSHCVGFPGTMDSAAFRRYIERCQIPSTFAFGAYTRTPLVGVVRALNTQKRLIALLEATQGAPPEAQLSAFRSFATDVSAAPRSRGTA